MDCGLHTSIPDWIVEHPETNRVFDELGLDSSCGGKSLEYVCHQHGLRPQDVQARLSDAIANGRDESNN